MPYALLSYMFLVVSAPTHRSVDVLKLDHSRHIYAFNAMDNGAVTVMFPFACSHIDFPASNSLTIMPPESDAGNYFVVVSRGAKVGTVLQGTAHCDKVSLALQMTVVPAASASPRVDVVFSDEDQRVIDQYLAAAIAAEKASCQLEVSRWRDGPVRQLSWLLKQRSERRDDVALKLHARSDSFLILHVDGRSHLGDHTIVDFRIQNRESKQLVVQRVEVRGQSSSKILGEFSFTDEELGKPVTKSDAIWLPMTVLAPGATARGSVMFQRGVNDHRITLKATAIGEQEESAEVTNIEL